VQALYQEAKHKEEYACVLERAAAQAPTRADAQRLEAERRAARDAARQLRAEAQRLALEARNAGSVSTLPLDLHGLGAAEATRKVREVLSVAQGAADATRGVARVEAIFGRGNHSGGDGPVLRPVVLDLLKREYPQHAAEVPRNNPGMVVVTVLAR
jgi:DNA-nicking Smr family endonuclease